MQHLNAGSSGHELAACGSGHADMTRLASHGRHSPLMLAHAQAEARAGVEARGGRAGNAYGGTIASRHAGVSSLCERSSRVSRACLPSAIASVCSLENHSALLSSGGAAVLLQAARCAWLVACRGVPEGVQAPRQHRAVGGERVVRKAEGCEAAVPAAERGAQLCASRACCVPCLAR
jgi:hypothetical protein